MVECLSSIFKALGSIPSTGGRKEKEKIYTFLCVICIHVCIDIQMYGYMCIRGQKSILGIFFDACQTNIEAGSFT